VEPGEIWRGGVCGSLNARGADHGASGELETFRFLEDLTGKSRDDSGQARNDENKKSAATAMSSKRFHLLPFFSKLASIPVGTTKFILRFSETLKPILLFALSPRERRSGPGLDGLITFQITKKFSGNG
jgi:hypothetical protein